ncbi:MAG: hypothetical protein F6K16_01260 [Symploca sp. SIO2B6]|nr:hypothetical protein [Symploca sp. SIO2B6]
MAENSALPSPSLGHLNSVQLNVITVVDLHKAVANNTLDGALYMIDNSVGSTGRGTAHLQTVCKQGQVINWLIYAMDMELRTDKTTRPYTRTLPPLPRINNIVFLDEQEGDEEYVAESKVCTEFKIYGGPDKIYSQDPLTPLYFYWAGTVLSDLPPGVYKYRLILELEQESTKEKVYLNTVEKPSLKVIKMSDDFED